MKTLLHSAAIAGIAGTALLAPGAAKAGEVDRSFFKTVQGSWTGPGEIVAGKYKGTKFNCTFQGTTPDRKVGMTLDGGCRVGPFLQKMTASIESQDGRYKGTFLDGAKGKGLDIVSGNVVDGQKVVLALNRQQLTGVMQARVVDPGTMTVTVSVRVAEQLVPVIGVSLKRVDATAVGSID
jgi:hypothetical protein